MPRIRRAPVASDKRFRQNRAGPSDFGPRERWQHSGAELGPSETPGLLVVRATESTLVDLLAARRWLNLRQNKAALRFKADYHRAAMDAPLCSRYAPRIAQSDPFRDHERSDAEEAAYQRWRLAVRAMGPGGGLAITTLCHDMMPARSDVARLRAALDRLADWYGIDRV